MGDCCTREYPSDMVDEEASDQIRCAQRLAPPPSREGDDTRMTQLVRPQLAQQIDAAVFDQVTVLGRERLVCQLIVKGLAEMDKLCGLVSKINHGRTPYGPEGQGVREGMREGINSLTWPHGKRYRTC